MDLAAELARLHSDPVLAELAKALQSQLDARDAAIKQRDFKIQQLTVELAQHKRIRFGTKSESLSPEQRQLFADACEEDGAAIVAEME